MFKAFEFLFILAVEKHEAFSPLFHVLIEVPQGSTFSEDYYKYRYLVFLLPVRTVKSYYPWESLFLQFLWSLAHDTHLWKKWLQCHYNKSLFCFMLVNSSLHSAECLKHLPNQSSLNLALVCILFAFRMSNQQLKIGISEVFTNYKKKRTNDTNHNSAPLMDNQLLNLHHHVLELLNILFNPYENLMR